VARAIVQYSRSDSQGPANTLKLTLRCPRSETWRQAARIPSSV